MFVDRVYFGALFIFLLIFIGFIGYMIIVSLMDIRDRLDTLIIDGHDWEVDRTYEDSLEPDETPPFHSCRSVKVGPNKPP